MNIERGLRREQRRMEKTVTERPIFVETSVSNDIVIGFSI
jgi:hypothetical protein